MRRIAHRLYAFFASYALSCLLFVLLGLLTLLGTLEQVESGLYDVQKKYFESIVLVHRFHVLGMDIPVVLPGVYLLLILLTMNLITGTIKRIRFTWANAGILVIHFGMLVMLAGGFVTFRFSFDGHMTLGEGESSDAFLSYHEWEFAIVRTSGEEDGMEWIVPVQKYFHDWSRSVSSREFFAEMLPFDFIVDRGYRNARVRPEDPAAAADVPVVDGFFVEELPIERENENNTPAAYIRIRDKQTRDERRAILWGAHGLPPLTVEAGGAIWDLSLRRKRWHLPFRIALKKFTRQLHPGTTIPKVFRSDVVLEENGIRRDVKISMNEPLRHGGYTFFQASYIEDTKTGALHSTLAVVKNPADQWPLISCVIVTLGMIVHFGKKLLIYLGRARAGLL